MLSSGFLWRSAFWTNWIYQAMWFSDQHLPSQNCLFNYSIPLKDREDMPGDSFHIFFNDYDFSLPLHPVCHISGSQPLLHGTLSPLEPCKPSSAMSSSSYSSQETTLLAGSLLTSIKMLEVTKLLDVLLILNYIQDLYYQIWLIV